MHKVSLQQAVKMTGRSESTLRRDVKKGKTSADRDERKHLRFDVAERSQCEKLCMLRHMLSIPPVTRGCQLNVIRMV